MGIFIHLDISKSITNDEWSKVYEESKLLAQAFELGDCQKVNIHGQNVYCMVRSKEKIEKDYWSKKTYKGWETCGDCVTMRCAENAFVPEKIVKEGKIVEPEAGDAILGELPAYLDYSYEDDKYSHVYRLWGNKTQGEPYHLFLLAIACLFEDRLGNKVFIEGDITRGQCRKAVKLANQHLKNKINLPSRCDMERLYKRINALDLSEQEKLIVFLNSYLGNKDLAFGEFIKTHYSADVLNQYWDKEFSEVSLSRIGLTRAFSNYMLWGFDFKGLFDFICLKDDEKEYESFIQSILSTKLHLKQKYTHNPIEIDQEAEHTYGIWTLLAQFAFAGGQNNKIDRYIPIEEIRSILLNQLGNRCDVNAIIEQYLEKEKTEIILNKDDLDKGNCNFEDYPDKVDTFNKVLSKKLDEAAEYQHKYDIAEAWDAIFYQKGDSIAPPIIASMKSLYKLSLSLITENECIQFEKEGIKERFNYLAKYNRYVLLRDRDWNRMYDKMLNDATAFGRYYTMVRTKVSSDEIESILRAWAINDDFYHQCKVEFEQAEQHSE